MLTKRKKQDKWLTQAQFDALSSLEDGVVYHITDAKVDYDTEVSNRPILKTDNTTAQATSASETITGTINLHKVAKTGNYPDLNNLPTLGTAAAKDAGTQNGVADLDANGKVPVNELPISAKTGSAAPTTSTVADYVGQIYLDTTNNNTYQCTAITSDGATPPVYTYTWVKIIRSTDKAGYNDPGVVAIPGVPQTYGINSMAYGGNSLIIVEPAPDTNITNRDGRAPITPTNLNFAVKASLTDANHLTMTSVEQEQAVETIGAAQFSAYNYHNSLGSGVIITDCTTLEQIVTLAINNPKTVLVGAIGNDPGNQPLRTLLGFPNGWGNYVDVISTSYQKLSATNMKVLELMAYNLYGNQTAKGYIFVNKDPNNANNLVYNWSGWLGNDGSEVVWTGNVVSTGVIQNIDLSGYKLARVYYDCYGHSQENYAVKGGVIEFDPTRSWSAASQALVYNVYNSGTNTWDLTNDMGITIVYDSTAHTVTPKMHYGGTLQTSSLYAVYKIEGVRR